MKRLLLPATALAAALLLTGCPRNEYVVELKPDGDALERVLTCQRYDGDSNARKPQEFPEQELAALKALYPRHEFDAASHRHTFRGRVVSVTPDDVGGAGTFLRYATSLGTVSVYTERFRGQDDQWARLERRARSADRFTDLLIGWLETELGKEPGFAKLRVFLDAKFRHDLKNASLMMYQAELAERFDRDAPREFAVRAAQFLHERGYFKRDELPLVLDLINGSETKTEALAFLKRWLAERMGAAAGAPAPKALDFLDDERRVDESLESFMQKTDVYQERLAAWKEEHAGDPHADLPKPADVLGGVALEAFDLELAPTLDELTVRLSLPAAPVFTNGKWDEAKREVVWQAGIEPKKPRRLPVLCHAIWGAPDAAFQKARFGKVTVTGERLARYALWRVNLPEKQAAEWEAFLAALRPGGDLSAKLDGFHFTGEDATTASKAAEAIGLLKAGLTEGRE